MIRQVEVEISDTDTAGSLYDKLKIAGAKLLIDSLEEILNGQVERIPQDHSQATYAPNIKSEDERIDWNRPARDVYNQIRGLNPWPVAYTEYRGARLKIWASALPETESIHKDVNAQNVAPGTVVNTDDGVIEVAVKDGTIQLTEVQPAGKRKMTAADLIRRPDSERRYPGGRPMSKNDVRQRPLNARESALKVLWMSSVTAPTAIGPEPDFKEQQNIRPRRRAGHRVGLRYDPAPKYDRLFFWTGS